MTKIYIVYSYIGYDYDGEESKNIKAFRDRDLADKCAKDCEIENKNNQALSRNLYTYINKEWHKNNPLPDFPREALAQLYITPAIRAEVEIKRDIWRNKRIQAEKQWLIDNGIPEDKVDTWPRHYADYEFLIEEIELDESYLGKGSKFLDS